MTGLIRIFDQIDVGNRLLLFLDDERPLTQYREVAIDGISYEPIIPYGANKCVAIDAKGDFTGKEIKFV